MAPASYISKVRIEHLGVPDNRAVLPPDGVTVLFGVHGEIAEHYRIIPGTFEPHAATLDYVVAAAGGCLTGTFGGHWPAGGSSWGKGGLTADVHGEIEREDDNVLVIKRIHVTYHLSAPPEFREKVLRAYEVHATKCPVYRSLTAGIAITTELDWNAS